MRLTSTRYDEIDKEVVRMFSRVQITSFPIDCFDLCKQLGYKFFSYSEVKGTAKEEFLDASKDGFHCVVELSPNSFEYWIFYNDEMIFERIRFTIMHEIGHIILGHTEHSELAESEANHFAAYALAPPPLVHRAGVEDYCELAAIFGISIENSFYAMRRYNSWLIYGGSNPDSKEIVSMFKDVM